MCTSLMAGKKATCDGTILLSRNEDYTRNNWNKYMIFRPFPEYYNKQDDNAAVSDNVWTLGNGLKVPLPQKMYRYNAMPDAAGYEEATYAIGRRFFFEERGINERNVAISATNSLTINDNASGADPLLVSGGIAESVIPTLLLPQVESAKEAVKLLGRYVEKYGASEVNGILIGDPDESWYFEIGSCHHWIAVKIPEDSYLVVANGMRVHSVDLDNEDVLHSKKLFKFVCEHKLLEAPDRHNFNFAEAFGIPGDPYNVDRIWLAQKILTPSLKQKSREYQYPLFLKPDKKIHIRDVMNVLRATYKGTELEGIAERPIGVDRTAESHIMVLDPKMPQELKGLIWQVVSTPMGAPYIPLYSVMDDIPHGFSLEGNQYSPLSAYWSFRGLYSLCEVNHDEYRFLVEKLWRDYEEQSFREYEPIKETLMKIYASDPSAAIDFAKRYSTGIAYQTVGIANKERDLLMTKITSDTQ
ncbi:C69 family dipeptidase [Methanosarcina sp. DH1]|uniref:C69 family dipeptidase n=1 Tax=Methanosarcina sp. DH1 TaxID=2605695 RepID=UPI001E2EA827|nr:C69 family dipeptidase [Methanosarcina sp. DH1]MCC4767403.1 C69 family dipeptidase [Methanosarcina sp. DH1]